LNLFLLVESLRHRHPNLSLQLLRLFRFQSFRLRLFLPLRRPKLHPLRLHHRRRQQLELLMCL
jgi:hypothetical protein